MRSKLIASLLALYAIVGCQQSGSDIQTLPQCPPASAASLALAGSSSGSTNTQTLIQQYEVLQVSLVESSCSTCHGATNPSGGIDLTDETTFNNNLTKIISAITQTPSNPSFMPKGGAQVSTSVINQVKAYAAQYSASQPTKSSGGSGSSGTHLQTTSNSPAHSATVSPGVPQNCTP